ncbi:glycosyltransferase 87 family protein, partial [Oscillochloris sp. ZM17-4]|uniref:glycosyltransferase 87 family protein n=1 Tax=Oscillochloris sp. ZM17-4 TaxID=2866714 RepID=UPI001C72DDF1
MRRIWPDTLALLLLCAAAPLWLALAYGGHRGASFAADALPVMLPTAGLHELEPLADRPDLFRWTTGAARVQPPNPGGPLSLRLSLASGFAQATPAVLRASGSESSFFILPGLRTYSLLLPAQPGERVSLQIDSPAETVDGRALGVVFHTLSIAGDGPPPAMLIASMLLATLGVYPLLRRAGMGAPAALAAVLALQATAAAWQAAGLWRYAFLGQLLAAGGAAALGALVISRWQAAGGRWQVSSPASRLSPPASERSERPASRLLPPALLLLLALLMCLPWLGAPDPVGDLKLSARRMGFMFERGGFSQAFSYGGDYMPLRLYILRGLSFLVGPLGGAFYDPVPAVTRALIKLPSILALLATVALLYWWGLRHAGPRRAALIAGLYAVIPPVWMNVAWWGQVDVLLALPMAASVALLDVGRGRWSWLCWAAGVMVKPQAIILAPLLYVLTVRRHGARGLVEGGALAAGLIGLACAPFVLIGQGPGLYQAAAGSVGRFPQVTNRAYNLWWLVAEDQPISDLVQVAGLSYRSIGFALVALAAGLACLAALRRPGGPSRAAAAAALAMAFFALPTQIHERYAFFALPFLLLCAAADLRALVPFLLLTVTATVNIVGAIPGFFPDAERVIVRYPIPTVVAWANMAILVGLLRPYENPPMKLDDDNLYDRGVAALRAGERARARELLAAAVRADPRSAAAWLWLSGALDDPAKQRECLERAAALDPQDVAAQRGLAALRAGG